jgi:hypothetical protein
LVQGGAAAKRREVVLFVVSANQGDLGKRRLTLENALVQDLEVSWEDTEDGSEVATVGDYRITVSYDSYPMNPREWDNLGTLWLYHKRYNLGDKEPAEVWENCVQQHNSWEDAFYEVLIHGYVPDDIFTEDEYDTLIAGNYDTEEYGRAYEIAVKWIEENVLYFPVSMYEHGGISIFPGEAHGWDSGQIGYSFVLRDKVIKEYGAWNPSTQDMALLSMRAEVKLYSQYVNGYVYQFTVEKLTKCPCCGHISAEAVDACGGFFDLDYCKEEALAAVKAEIANSAKQDTE